MSIKEYKVIHTALVRGAKIHRELAVVDGSLKIGFDLNKPKNRILVKRIEVKIELILSLRFDF